MATTRLKPKARLRHLSESDVEALTLALELQCAESAEMNREIRAKIAAEGWEKIAREAAWACQDRALRCKPWEWVVPARVDDLQASLLAPPDDHTGRRGAAELLQKMLAAGISRFHPDPVGALRKAETVA
jgi:hypothetical protein